MSLVSKLVCLRGCAIERDPLEEDIKKALGMQWLNEGGA